MPFMGLSDEQREALQFEVVPGETRLKLTRLLRYRTDSTDMNVATALRNRAINIARNVLKLPVMVLEPDDWGDYETATAAWHISELELVMRRAPTAELVETLADMIQAGVLKDDEVNELLEVGGTAVSFKASDSVSGIESVDVVVQPIPDIDNEAMPDEHPNIRVLVERMERSLKAGDHAAVLHASASIFETLAKDVMADPSVENKSLGQIFDRYKHESKLSPELLNYIQSIFRSRSTEPLAGHGSTLESNVSAADATILSEMTKAIVRCERQLASPALGREVRGQNTASPGKPKANRGRGITPLQERRHE